MFNGAIESHAREENQKVTQNALNPINKFSEAL